MKLGYKLIAIVLLFFVTACDEEINGIVVDAETGRPIEGAVILVEWMEEKGLPGLRISESYKVVEVMTDKEGKAHIEGVFSPFVDPPYVAVYKKGYVAWSNRFIFPNYKKRTDFKWENDYMFKLEKFKEEYSYQKHVSFISNAVRGRGASEGKRLMADAYRWEELKAMEEMRKEWMNKSKGY